MRREIQMRYAVYPGRVINTKMSQAQMDREIGLMEAAADSVEKMAKNGLFRESWNTMATARSLTSQELVALLLETQNKANSLAEAGQLVEAYRETVKLAGFTLRLAELIKEIHEKPAADASAQAVNPIPALPAHPPLPQKDFSAVVDRKDLGLEYASAEQREGILRLLNHPAINRSEKTKQLLNINRRTPSQAEAIIARLNDMIRDHEGPIAYRQAS